MARRSFAGEAARDDAVTRRGLRGRRCAAEEQRLQQWFSMMSLFGNLFGRRSRYGRFGGFGRRSRGFGHGFGGRRGMTLGGIAAIAAPFLIRKLRSRRAHPGTASAY